MGLQDSRSGLFVLFLLFRFIGVYAAVQPFSRGPLHLLASPSVCDSDLFGRSSRSVSLPFPTLSIHTECALTFLSASHLLHEGVFALPILCSICDRLRRNMTYDSKIDFQVMTDTAPSQGALSNSVLRIRKYA